MSEPNAATTITTNARDAAMASLGDDFGKPDTGGDDGADGAVTEDVVGGANPGASGEPAAGDAGVAAPKPLEAAPKPEPLSPQLAAIARKEQHVREQQATLKAERDAHTKERQEWEASKGSVDSVHAEVGSDIVGYADKRKLSNEQRRQMAEDLYWSTQEEAKRPPTFRNQSRTRSAIDLANEKAEQALKRAADLEASIKEREHKAEEREVQGRVIGEILADIPETARLTKAFIKFNPQQAKADLWAITLKLAQANPNAELTPAQVAAEYESLLDKQSAWTRGVGGEVASPIAPRGTQASNPLTNERAASPAMAGGGPKDAAARRAEALASLKDEE